MRSLVFVLLLCTYGASAQTVKVNTYDRFIKKHVIETSKVTLKQEKDELIQARIGAVGTTFSIFFEGYGEGALTIRANDNLIFLLSNDSTVVAKSVEPQTFDIEGDRSTYEHEYSINPDALQMLSRSSLVAIRKYGVSGHVDMKIPANKQEELKRASLLMLNEIAKVK